MPWATEEMLKHSSPGRDGRGRGASRVQELGAVASRARRRALELVADVMAAATPPTNFCGRRIMDLTLERTLCVLHAVPYRLLHRT